MKLDKMTFAKLVAHCISNGMSAGEYEVNELDNICDINVPVQSPVKPNQAEVDKLMRLMADGTQKIEAIKAYRNLTGAYLMEAKDAVEKYWVSKPAATLGDILDTARGPVNFNKFEG